MEFNTQTYLTKAGEDSYNITTIRKGDGQEYVLSVSKNKRMVIFKESFPEEYHYLKDDELKAIYMKRVGGFDGKLFVRHMVTARMELGKTITISMVTTDSAAKYQSDDPKLYGFIFDPFKRAEHKRRMIRPGRLYA